MEKNVNHPKHYNAHPSGVECIEIARHYDFNIGNSIKYIWRHGLKHEDGMPDQQKQIEDLEKAIFYLQDEIEMLKGRKQDGAELSDQSDRSDRSERSKYPRPNYSF